jgi:type VI secretion system protein ImpK
VPALPAAPKAERNPEAVDVAALGGVNPLVAAANPVLSIAAQIRHTFRHADPAGLRATLARGVDAFEARARAEGIDDEVTSRASLALCALVDESAGSTPWGAGWIEDGFVAARHGRRSADEEFFRILEELRGNPATNRHLLEFYYVCLSLGFEGRFHGTPDGRTTLEALRAELLELLRAQRPASDGELSAHWRGVEMPARKPLGTLGLWTAAAVTGLFLAGLYIFYGTSLGGLSDPVARDLAQIKVTPPPQKPSAVGAVVVTPRIAEQLAGEIAKGEVAIVGAAATSTIVIRSDRLFASGSARLEGAVEPVVLRVAEALEQVPGTVVVTGHTDDVPIRTARFPSNWELSTERAASVVRLMSSRLKDPARLRAEGLADSTPAAPNDSTVNRARNRRVEINLRSAP